MSWVSVVGLVKKSSHVKILLLAILLLLVVGCTNKSQIRRDLTNYLDLTTQESLASLETQSRLNSYWLTLDLYNSDENKRQTVFQKYKLYFDWASSQTIWLDELHGLWQQKHTSWDVQPYGRHVYVVRGYELGWKDSDFWPGQWYYYDYPGGEREKRFEPADSYALQLYYEITKTYKR